MTRIDEILQAHLPPYVAVDPTPETEADTLVRVRPRGGGPPRTVVVSPGLGRIIGEQG
jgi:hypothetical protein